MRSIVIAYELHTAAKALLKDTPVKKADHIYVAVLCPSTRPSKASPSDFVWFVLKQDACVSVVSENIEKRIGFKVHFTDGSESHPDDSHVYPDNTPLSSLDEYKDGLVVLWPTVLEPRSPTRSQEPAASASNHGTLPTSSCLLNEQSIGRETDYSGPSLVTKSAARHDPISPGPPPTNAERGSKNAPWLQLTPWELALLRRKMKKNSRWMPSDSMIARELNQRGRGIEAYRRARHIADAKGESIRIPPQLLGQKVDADGALSIEAVHGNQAAKLANRGTSINQAKTLARVKDEAPSPPSSQLFSQLETAADSIHVTTDINEKNHRSQNDNCGRILHDEARLPSSRVFTSLSGTSSRINLVHSPLSSTCNTREHGQKMLHISDSEVDGKVFHCLYNDGDFCKGTFGPWASDLDLKTHYKEQHGKVPFVRDLEKQLRQEYGIGTSERLRFTAIDNVRYFAIPLRKSRLSSSFESGTPSRRRKERTL